MLIFDLMETKLFGEITHHLVPDIGRMLAGGMLRNEDPYSIVINDLLAIEIKLLPGESEKTPGV